ncbi:MULTISPECIES: ABC transporter substrate-binding protein [unclassified Duganella]|jgi:ABC-type amino acid transport substrate-binding protein|uniref:substrate-binding periplasmic protein n=1 Tax=unclassified Duganella TaxID=2636909 RepID=UPI00087E1DB6|nr:MULTISPECIES: transporter substrate-binding domain-containing protein [unclassified Duganella]SDG64308.1 ABC-type amino acid transport substrate-binding protein [Duganella sp. OV458]SDJ89339.1 ABC-type amino acid transport substrate-binding protein [Duganella sp. OV510]
MPRCWPAMLTAAFTSLPAAAQGPDTLIFGTTHESDSVVYQYATAYLNKLCAEIRQRCQLQSLPGRRAEAMLADGSIVGEMGRVKDYGRKHPHYLRIDEPFVQTRTFVFTPAAKPAIDSWQELTQQARTVSYKRGIHTYQTRLEMLRPQVTPHDVQTVPACLQMVIAGRDQACVYDDGSLSAASRAMLSLGRIGKPLEELDLYIYLGRDQRALAGSINAAAGRLHAQGLNAELRRKYFISP